MKVLVIGSGGREHALAWKLARSPLVDKLYVAPGNPGSWSLAERAPVDHEDLGALADFAAAEGIDLSVVGPDHYLALGLVDELARRGLRAFGPTRAAAAIEWDKVFAKDFMIRHGIPTAAYAAFDDYREARSSLATRGAPIVVKAQGLAAGKGAVVCRTTAEAEKALADMMERRVFGEAGARVVIEEYMPGEEASLFVLTDGETAFATPVSQDHKQVFDGDEGPNTGGMGAYAPAGVFTRGEMARVMGAIVYPALRGLAAEGRTYRGVLYVQLMKTAEGPKVVEFNSRFGDPETQALMPLLRSDLAEICLAAAEGGLARCEPRWLPGGAVCVVLASGGYPGRYETGRPISGLAEAAALPGTLVFHAGTARRGGEILTAGGRVLNVVGTGADVAEARERAYAAVTRIGFADMHYRKDIAWREVARPSASPPAPKEASP